MVIPLTARRRRAGGLVLEARRRGWARGRESLDASARPGPFRTAERPVVYGPRERTRPGRRGQAGADGLVLGLSLRTSAALSAGSQAREHAPHQRLGAGGGEAGEGAEVDLGGLGGRVADAAPDHP